MDPRLAGRHNNDHCRPHPDLRAILADGVSTVLAGMHRSSRHSGGPFDAVAEAVEPESAGVQLEGLDEAMLYRRVRGCPGRCRRPRSLADRASRSCSEARVKAMYCEDNDRLVARVALNYGQVRRRRTEAAGTKMMPT